jgi:hypothetical protein
MKFKTNEKRKSQRAHLATTGEAPHHACLKASLICKGNQQHAAACINCTGVAFTQPWRMIGRTY